MKNSIKNLLMPLAVVAMLTVGAFTVNASNNTDKAVKVETVVLTQNTYLGELYYFDGSTYQEVVLPSRKDCEFDGNGPLYIEKISSVNQQIYGWDSSAADYRPLHLIM
ncbi:hypothetical protein [Myroides sp. LoEW2-1]|uniref:hypothetical protein n=1 Tax=Myroides sp. LoEW2-1 TaxID=2683192 RepID=UPI00132A8523|nr:hypothetical protein [Myroides sp. LoEW2-1]MVX34294.1 hypothetical protein [Myroides sp. LoEW2-1]